VSVSPGLPSARVLASARARRTTSRGLATPNQTQLGSIGRSLTTQNSSSNNPGILTIRKSIEIGTLASSSTMTVNGAAAFALNNIYDYTSWAAVYDLYRITLIKVMFIPVANLSPNGTNPSVSYLSAAVDFDDITVPSAPAEIINYQNHIILGPSGSGTLTWKPRVALAAYSGAFTSYASKEDQWIDCSSASVEHYGLKYSLKQATTTSIHNWLAFAELTVQFKNQR
jgi:hypothetical protein